MSAQCITHQHCQDLNQSTKALLLITLKQQKMGAKCGILTNIKDNDSTVIFAVMTDFEFFITINQWFYKIKKKLRTKH